MQVVEKCRIPAQSETFLRCWSGKFLSETNGVIEAESTCRKQGLLVARSLVKSNNGNLVVSVLNLSHHAITLAPDSVVGTISAVDSVVGEVDLCPETGTKSGLPSSLQTLVNNSSRQLDLSQKRSVAGLIEEL